MSSNCFVDQIASHDILLKVTNVCGECYDTIELGDQIYYDMQSYRYLCDSCHKELCDKMNEECEVIYDDDGLFG